MTGSIKFDLSIPESVAQKSAPLKAMWQNRPVWIAASTHPGEEEQILSAHKQILSTFPNALLILVPRHPERFLMVKTLCETQGFQVVTRSSNSPCTPETQVYLGDSVGELLVYYASVPIAFVGGSLVNTGGHNTLEPAALGLALITGPHTFNFKEITRMLKKAGASISVESSQALAKEVTRLLEDAALCKGMGEKALSTVLANRGALDRLLAIIAHEMPQ